MFFLFSAPPPLALPPSFTNPTTQKQGVMRMELNWSPPSGKQQEKIAHSERQEGVTAVLPYGRMTSLAFCPFPTVHNGVTVAFSVVPLQPRKEERWRERGWKSERAIRERKGKRERMPAMLRPKGFTHWNTNTQMPGGSHADQHSAFLRRDLAGRRHQAEFE